MRGASAATVAASARASTRGVPSTGTSPDPTACAVSASVTVNSTRAASPGCTCMVNKPKRRGPCHEVPAARLGSRPSGRTLACVTFLSHLECPRCGAIYDATRPANLCTACGSPLYARYDLDAVAAKVRPDDLVGRAADLWRYREVLPVSDPAHVVTLGEGWTPLLPARRYGESVGVPRLLIKDEGVIPTGSLKARRAALGVSRALELGIRHVAMPTNGNAGAAWATYAARAGMRATVAMPLDAPVITRRECVAAGADVYLVDGLIGDAGKMIGAFVAGSDGSVFDASTLKEPYRLEGKKTMGYEIAEQLDWKLPDVIVYPTGGGVGLIGIHKA